MYFKRHIDAALLEWKSSRTLKPLLLRGARQVGKSRSVRHLGETFEYYAEINFELRPEAKLIFQELTDVKEIVARLSVLLNIPIEAGKTLLFLDEIQSCPQAIHSLWAFKENMPDLHVAAAGSLLEFTLKEISSFGVGRIRSMFMYPLSFDEFLMASGYEKWVEVKNKHSYTNPLPSELHSQLIQQFRSFLLVGGMPASVAAWVETHDYRAAADELEDIQQSYYDDFAKYSEKIDTTLLRNTLRSVILQTGCKFVYSRVEGGYSSDLVKKALTMLCDAGLVKVVQYSAGNGLPLGAEINDKFRKYNYIDSGLMMRVLDIELDSSQPITELIIAGTAEDLVNKGQITEIVAGWEIVKYSSSRTNHDLYYWENIARGTTSEIDYLVAKNLKILPLEIKSGVTGKMKSLRFFMNKKGLTEAKRCSLENFGLITYADPEAAPSAPIRTIYIHPLYCLATLTTL